MQMKNFLEWFFIILRNFHRLCAVFNHVTRNVLHRVHYMVERFGVGIQNVAHMFARDDKGVSRVVGFDGQEAIAMFVFVNLFGREFPAYYFAKNAFII